MQSKIMEKQEKLTFVTQGAKDLKKDKKCQNISKNGERKWVNKKMKKKPNEIWVSRTTN